MAGKKNDVTDRDIKKILKEYGVKNEEDFERVINEEWKLVECTRCGKLIDLTTCSFEDGDPVCYGGCNHANT